eukprot:6844084-Lingulodinium_polyedra.AAC.1
MPPETGLSEADIDDMPPEAGIPEMRGLTPANPGPMVRGYGCYAGSQTSPQRLRQLPPCVSLVEEFQIATPLFARPAR